MRFLVHEIPPGIGHVGHLDDGYVPVPEEPGLGVDLDENVIEDLLIDGEEMFAPTPEWSEQRSWDRTWS